MENVTAMTRTALIVAACVLYGGHIISAQGQKLKEVKIQGYVTDVKSPTVFEIEDYRITRDQGFVLDFENASPDISFKAEDIRVGVELEIKGSLNESTGELKAKSIKIDLEQFRPAKQTAIIATPIQGLQKSGNGWSGRFAADGQAIVITPTTQVLFKPTNREKKLIKQQKQASGVDADGGDEGFEPLTSLDQVDIGMALTYEGTRSQDGTEILASRLEFSRNDLENGEARLWKSLKASVKGAESLSGGELKISQVGKFKLLPDPTVQEYVASIGRKLVPPYQSRLSATDPSRIPFQFYVVKDDEANAFALPSGIVVVNSGLIEFLDNEAQFAEVIGHEMAHATHEHTWRQQNYKKKTRIGIALAGAVANAYGMRSLGDIANMVNAALVSGYSRTLENQADRVGLEYMTAAGYDPREAPAVWKLMTKKYGLEATNFFYSSHDNHAVRRSYLMNELKNNYRGIDFSALHTNTDEFARIKAAVVAAKNPKRRLKVS